VELREEAFGAALRVQERTRERTPQATALALVCAEGRRQGHDLVVRTEGHPSVRRRFGAGAW
jgi:hypothetical protein